MSALEVGKLASDAEEDALKSLLGASYGLTPAMWSTWFERIGRDNLRVVREGGSVIGGLGMYRFGHFYGGKSVQSAGIAGVGVAPEKRSTGAAKELLVTTLRELRALGTPLSSLYASTQYLYRSVGYEHAGQATWYRAPAASLRQRTRVTLDVRRVLPPAREAFEPTYTQVAKGAPGHLDRSDAIWQRKLIGRDGDVVYGYVFSAPGGAAEGYVVYVLERVDMLHFDVRVRDMKWTTPRAASAMLQFLSDQRSLARDVLWQGPPNESLVTLLSEQSAKVELVERFFVRMTHLENAFERRGYAVDGELHLQVADALIPEQNGPFSVVVENGVGRVTRGGKGTLKLDVRALASLYAGMYSASQLARVGALDAPERDLAAADRLLAGPPPWIADMF